MRPRTVAVIQARIASVRLPRKVLLELAERTVIDWVVERARRAQTIDQVVVATTQDASDDALAAHCVEAGYPYVRGSASDVLDRMVTAAASERADVVVRLRGHSPLVDPEVMDLVVRTHLGERRDYTANRLPEPQPHAYPPGLGVEVVSMSALTDAWASRRDRAGGADATSYLYEAPGRYNVRLVGGAPVTAADARWSIRTRADLEALRALVRAARAELSTPWTDLLAVWQRNPEIAALNGDGAELAS